MARFAAAAALFVFCAFVAATVTVSASHSNLTVKGTVLLDYCNAGFETEAAVPLAGATVKLMCNCRKSYTATHTDYAVTDLNGEYTFSVQDHGDDVCDATLVSSSHTDASAPLRGRDSSRLSLTHNNGMVDGTRQANILLSGVKTPLARCGQILARYHLNDDNF
ncbi:unnamed protein product [Cuscuta epithymum]|uniref:Uncharacterized protein n=1 Tax=Cuscuta epithymum TaxID=186058 RepID=A0AAV0GFY5_9ASTE|nr:unnamed protein product [Cuscuta epithymum]